jgi:putative FmdB family regulatory protein
MPMYRYVCEKCGSQMEVMQKVSDAPLKRCKKCRGKLEKAVSRTSFTLKGSGWYATDYSGKAAPAKKTEGSGDSKAESSPSPAKKDSAGVGTGD